MNDLLNVIQKTSALAGQNNPRRANDYTKAGLLYCGFCHTPKQCRQEFLGRQLTVNCLCACAVKRRDEREANERTARTAQVIAELRRDGFSERGISECTFTADDNQNADPMQKVKDYADNFETHKKEGKGLVLYGGVGSGKTFAAACVCNALLSRLIPCLMTNAARVSNLSQAHFEDRQEYFDNLNRFDLLVLDDLSSERRSEYLNETVHSVIDARCRAKLPLIVTTNGTPKGFGHAADLFEGRIYSRLFGMCDFVDFGNHDRRRDAFRGNKKIQNSELRIQNSE